VLTIDQKKNLVFGVPLQQAVDATKGDGPLEVPVLVNKCIKFVEQYGLNEEGIYRISGNQTHLKELRERFDSGFAPFSFLAIKSID